MENKINRIIKMPIDSGLIGHVALSREVLNIIDAYQDKRFTR
jgi:hypothetical protein